MIDQTGETRTEPLLSVTDLAVSFTGDGAWYRAVDGVSFTVSPGETLAILGESGSGKSVTMRAVMGLLPARASRRDQGTVRFGGHELPARPGPRTRELCGREMSMVFQDSLSALNPVMTVGRQVAELFRVRAGMSRRAAHDAAVEVLERVGIPDAGRRYRSYPHEFSGGMRQRVVIAMALALGPRLLIADEPTTALDVTVQAQIMELIAQLRDETGMAVVLISHDLGVVADLARRVLVMYAGRVVESGPLREVYERPAHPYTVGLMASLPDAVTPGEKLRTIGGAPASPGALPPGCAFHPRCPLATERCRVEVPALRPVGDGRAAACHYAEAVLDAD
ncbi:ABC transporter ATP-binding protein [Jiangella gansuensis]|uniref:ABC transporter ATP-binding protein n=1 Tax=Jiangella gansuensis TaxID=281473 RepID=UPI00068729F4|nr:ABC transporter ATP-binding protein [Jiangella gansuensis]